LTKKLDVLKGEAETAQQTCSGLEKKVKQLEDSLTEFSKLSSSGDRQSVRLDGLRDAW
jgi:hypothetical protein